jgi:hypothetical protein
VGRVKIEMGEKKENIWENNGENDWGKRGGKKGN